MALKSVVPLFTPHIRSKYTLNYIKEKWRAVLEEPAKLKCFTCRSEGEYFLKFFNLDEKVVRGILDFSQEHFDGNLQQKAFALMRAILWNDEFHKLSVHMIVEDEAFMGTSGQDLPMERLNFIIRDIKNTLAKPVVVIDD